MADLSFGRDRLIYDYLRNNGLTPAAAAGMGANAFAESGYDPMAFNSAGGGQGALGMFQHRAERQDNLRAFAKREGMKLEDPLTHPAFALWEMKNDPGNAQITIEELNKITDPIQAGTVFRDKYERPGGHGYGNTSREALRLYNEYSGLDPIPQSALGAGNHDLSFSSSGDAGRAFANDADERSRNLQEILGVQASNMGMHERLALAALTPGNWANTVGGGGAAPAAAPQNGGQKGQTQLGFGAAGGGVPNEYGTTQPDAAAAASTKDNPETDPAKKPSLMDRLFAPTSEEDEGKPWYRRAGFTDALAALGTGLGQMSAGQPVNTIPQIEALRRGRTMAADAERQAETDQADLAMRARNAAVAERNADVAERRATIEEKQILAEEKERNAANIPLSDLTLDEIASSFPSLQTTIDAYKTQYLDTGVPNVDLGNKILDAAIDLGTDSADVDGIRRISDDARGVLNNALSGEITPAEFVDRVSQLPNADDRTELMKRYADFAPDPNADDGGTNKIKEVQFLFDEDQKRPAHRRRFTDLSDAMMEYSRINSGVENAAAGRNAERAQDFQWGVLEAATNASAVDDYLDPMLEASYELLAEGGSIDDFFTPLIRKVSKTAASMSMDEESRALMSELGYDEDALQTIDTAEQALGFLIARDLVRGQGSVTSDERRALLNLVAKGEMSHDKRIEVISRMQTLNAFDRATSREFARNDAFKPDYSDALGRISDHVNNTRPLTQRAAEALTEVRLLEQSIVRDDRNPDPTRSAIRSKVRVTDDGVAIIPKAYVANTSPHYSSREWERIQPMFQDSNMGEIMTYFNTDDGKYYFTETGQVADMSTGHLVVRLGQ